MECAICYKKINKRNIWKCKHCKNILHGKCYSDWSKQSETCPFCRGEETQESDIVCSIFCYALFIGFFMRGFSFISPSHE